MKKFAAENTKVTPRSQVMRLAAQKQFSGERLIGERQKRGREVQMKRTCMGDRESRRECVCMCVSE